MVIYANLLLRKFYIVNLVKQYVFSEIRCFVCLHQCVYSFMSFQEESNQSVWIFSYCLDVWLRVALLLSYYRCKPIYKTEAIFLS